LKGSSPLWKGGIANSFGILPAGLSGREKKFIVPAEEKMEEKLVSLHPLHLPRPGAKGEYPRVEIGETLCVLARPYPGKHIETGGYHMKITRLGNWEGNIYAIPIDVRAWRYSHQRGGPGHHNCHFQQIAEIACECSVCESARRLQT